MAERTRRLIPIGGGKGGVGKSILAANLSMALANKGKRVIVVDLDLGGSNLHSYLGISNDNPGIGDFLVTKEGHLSDYQTSTHIPHLTVIPGDGRTPFMANLTHGHKVKLGRHIQQLDADYIILDIGAGTSYNTIDYFGMSARGMLVTTPDFPALMNMLAFLKNFLLRNIIARISKLPRTEQVIKEIRNQTIGSSQFTIDYLRQRLATLNEEAAKMVDLVVNRYRPRVVFNLGDEAADLEVAAKVEQAAFSQLQVPIDWFGFLFHDAAVRRSVRARGVLMRDFGTSQVASGIDQLADRIIREWDRSIDDSYQLLMSDTKAFERQMTGMVTEEV